MTVSRPARKTIWLILWLVAAATDAMGVGYTAAHENIAGAVFCLVGAGCALIVVYHTALDIERQP